MPRSSRSRTPSASIESRLLDAAEEILEKEGPDGLSVRRIAAHAEVAPMGVYNHFNGKSGIIDALYIRGFMRLGENFATLTVIADPKEALIESGRRYRRFASDFPMSYRLMFLSAVPGYVPSAEASKIANGALQVLCRRSRAPQRLGSFGPMTQPSLRRFSGRHHTHRYQCRSAVWVLHKKVMQVSMC